MLFIQALLGFFDKRAMTLLMLMLRLVKHCWVFMTRGSEQFGGVFSQSWLYFHCRRAMTVRTMNFAHICMNPTHR